MATCLPSALQQIGRQVTVEEVVAEVLKDAPFYGSDGGVTISGGEPFYQPRFTIELLQALHSRGISTVLDTCGYGSPAAVEQALEYTNLVLLDLKHMDPEKHRQGTGVDNKLILNNAKVMASKCQVRISFPLIPGYNDGEENIRATALLARDLGLEWIDIEPLHSLGASKYEYLGLSSPYQQYQEIKREDVLAARGVIASFGLQTTIGRMM
ncbi:MAG: choline trimethylamine-lyase activating enzyme [Clostridia bacterium]|nr:choline trimethylamine-lyase activating enzyme [Clostridia bacterium]